MEDAATAEISRAQIWQWLKHSTTLKDGRIVTIELFKSILEDEINELKKNYWRKSMESRKV
jgi:malate synthase